MNVYLMLEYCELENELEKGESTVRHSRDIIYEYCNNIDFDVLLN